MSSVSTRATLENVNMEVYRAMAPALGINPNSQWLERHVGEFFGQDDRFISKGEQAKLNPFMRGVADNVRAEHKGYCPSEVLYQEASRRMKLAIHGVAGPTGTRDAKLLSRGEVGRIQNPLLRAMVARAADMNVASTASSSSGADYGNSTTTSGGAGAGCGPHYYGDISPGCGPVSSNPDPGWGPDGPNRSTSGSSWGPDGPSRGYGGSSRGYDDYSGGSGTTYIGGYPLI